MNSGVDIKDVFYIVLILLFMFMWFAQVIKTKQVIGYSLKGFQCLQEAQGTYRVNFSAMFQKNDKSISLPVQESVDLVNRNRTLDTDPMG